MMNNVSEHRQVWGDRLTRHTYSATEGSVVLEVYHQPQSSHGIEAYISNLMVEPEHCGKGYGNELMEWAEQKAIEAGYDKVFLQWNRAESKHWVLEWYERRGYSEQAFGRDGCLMMKKL